jgi:hypothetical protein
MADGAPKKQPLSTLAKQQETMSAPLKESNTVSGAALSSSGAAAPLPPALGPGPTAGKGDADALGNPPLVDGRCFSCTGVTYFSSALAEAREPAVCYGFRRAHVVPPPPFSFAGDVEKAARNQTPPAEIETRANGTFFNMAIGTTLTTPKMQKDGTTPYCAYGLAMTGEQPGLKRRQQQLEPAKPPPGAAPIPGAAATHAALAGKASDAAGGKKQTDAAEPWALVPFLASPAAFQQHVVDMAGRAGSFWSKAVVNYPARYVAFVGKMRDNAVGTCERMIDFSGKMLGYWAPPPRGGSAR